MKKINFFMSLSAVFLFVFLGSLSADTENRLVYTDISQSVVMAQHGYGSNIICICTDMGLYFVDTGLNTGLASRFRKDMEERFSRKTRALLITHAHTDHFFGMAAFSDVPVIAPAAGKKSWETQLAVEFNEKRIQAYDRIFSGFKESFPLARPFMPTRFFKDQIVLGQGERTLFFSTTGGHTADSSSVFFPSEGVLVSGDLVQVDRYPYFGDPTNNMDDWLAAFSKWEGMPIKKICPGHGRSVDKTYITLMKNYFLELISVLKTFKSSGFDVKDVIRNPGLPEGYWNPKAQRPIWFDYCIASLYQSL